MKTVKLTIELNEDTYRGMVDMAKNADAGPVEDFVAGMVEHEVFNFQEQMAEERAKEIVE